MSGSKDGDGSGNLWDKKGDLPPDGLPTIVKLLPLHFACNMAFQGTFQEKLGVHVTALSSCHPRYLDILLHKVAQEEIAGSRIVRSPGVVFVPANISRVVLELGADGLDAKCACRSFGLLLLPPSRSNNPALVWIQAIFTAQ